MDLGEKIKARRKALGLSQGELAERSGINPTHLSRLETGKYQPSVDVLKKLVEVLQVSADYLLQEDAPEPQEEEIRNKPLAEKIRLVDSLEAADQQALLQVIDSMLTKKRILELLQGERSAERSARRGAA
ncbi:MAG TPA: helix-turn-helix domain-containing protein [Longimicrobiaceae bacterium]|jgi:transcriptional regulator with XRE-family HTH domain|nr:helix-turn-helix domain-containing protein [Longimicrobiaceae bacterium]